MKVSFCRSPWLLNSSRNVKLLPFFAWVFFLLLVVVQWRNFLVALNFHFMVLCHCLTSAHSRWVFLCGVENEIQDLIGISSFSWAALTFLSEIITAAATCIVQQGLIDYWLAPEDTVWRIWKHVHTGVVFSTSLSSEEKNNFRSIRWHLPFVKHERRFGI